MLNQAAVRPQPPQAPRAENTRRPLSKRIRFEVLKRDGFRCLYCGKRPPDVTLEVDHVLAVANGGSSAMSNLIAACRDCNSGKSAVPLSQLPQSQMQTLAETQERVEQLKELCRVEEEERQAAESALTQLSRQWVGLCGIDPNKWGVNNGTKHAFRRFLTKLPFNEVADSIEIAFRNIGPSDKNKVFKYFCGCCWKKIHNRSEIEPG